MNDLKQKKKKMMIGGWDVPLAKKGIYGIHYFFIVGFYS